MGKILITGAAGFIGNFLSLRLLREGWQVVGIDSLNDYYDPELKKARLARIPENADFSFIRGDIADRPMMADLFAKNKFDVVVNLAAQAGVRYSIENPNSYIDANVVGFVNLLEGCRHSGVGHFVFASSSSVYGGNVRTPFSTHDNVDHPVSLYAATKKANELMAHCYSHLYGLHTTGLRFFTVYGPWGRPDMAYFLFTKAIMAGRPIKIFNNGRMKRDFTYIDDIIEGLVRIIANVPQPQKNWDKMNPDPASSWCPYKIYNIGNNQREDLMRYIEVLEDCLGKKAEKQFLPMQDGDVKETYANVDDLVRDIDFKPRISIEDGLQSFVKWYKHYYA
ncbi:MAG: NAD-dependent epimerase [Deltaproteobacteria bacterium]|nr:NAD-dependent epimerase [Deltaproteobacteria bacterium]